MTTRMIASAASKAFAALPPFIRALISRLHSVVKNARRVGVSREAMYVENFEILEQTLDYLNQGLAMVNPAGQVLIFNKRMLEYSGVDQKKFRLPAVAREVFVEQWQNGEFGDNGSLLPEDVRSYFTTGKGKLNR